MSAVARVRESSAKHTSRAEREIFMTIPSGLGSKFAEHAEFVNDAAGRNC
jgi:hypothetical protein